MVGPYMKSGESIVLTTDRVLIDDIEYEPDPHQPAARPG